MIMLRILRLLALVMLALLLMAIIALTTTTAGLQQAVSLLETVVPGLTIKSVNGSLMSHIECTDLSYQNKKVSLQANKVAIDWQFWALLQNKLQINDLQMDGVTLRIADKTGDSVKPHLPVKLALYNVGVHGLKLYSQQTKNILTAFAKKNPVIKGLAIDSKNDTSSSLIADISELQFSAHTACDIFSNMHINISKVSGRFGQQPINGQSEIIIENNNIQLNKVDFTLGKATIQANGHITDNWQLQWQITIPNLEQIVQNSTGMFYSKGSVVGPRLKPNVDAMIDAKNLKIGAIAIASLEGKAASDLKRQGHVNISLQAKQVHYDKYNAESVVMNLNGKPLGQSPLRGEFNASLQGQQLHYDNKYSVGYVTLDLQGKALGDLLTHSEFKMSLQGKQIHDDKYALDTLTIDGQGSPKDHKFTIVAKNGVDSAHVTFSGELKQKVWHGLLQQMQVNSNQVGDWNLAKPGSITLDKKNIAAKVSFATKQLYWLTNLVPDIKNTQGDVNFNLQLSGAIKKPTWAGSLQLTNGYTEIPSVAINLNNIAITGNFTEAGTINWQASAVVNSKPITLTGQSEALKPDFPTTLTLNGSEITIADTPQYKVIATPQVTLTYADNAFNLTGTIDVPSATIKTGSFSTSTVSLSDDVVFVDHNAKAKPKSKVRFTSQLQINLGDSVAIQTKGFNGRLIGSLLLNYDPQNQTTANGEIIIMDGKFSAYGQALTITNGRLVYTGGPIDNPTLNLQATRTVNTTMQSVATLGTGFMSNNFVQPGQVLVGINVSGPLKNYRIDLFSQPAVYNQSDILSLLLLGTPASQLDSAGSSILLNAITQLNLGNGQLSRITNQLQNIFGLNQLGIVSESAYNPLTQSIVQGPSLVVGKQIGKKLYISYSRGILSSINTVRLRYMLNKNLSIQSDASSMGHGVDLLYSGERD